MSKLTFNRETAIEMYLSLANNFGWSEDNRQSEDISRNHVNALTFDAKLSMLKMFGIDAECGIYNDGEYIRIGYARLNNRVFIENTKMNYEELKTALLEIAE